MQTGLYVFDVNYENPLNTNEFDETLLSVFPNPCSEALRIKTSSQTNTSVELLDYSGKVLLSEQFSSDEYSINTSGLSKGIYLLKLSIKNNYSTFKIQVQ